MVLGVLPTHGIQGAIAIAMYSWFFGLAVVDAERKRVAKEETLTKADQSP